MVLAPLGSSQVNVVGEEEEEEGGAEISKSIHISYIAT
jgi:hypothetical protein